ncbi:MAG: hypothetical protein WD770_07500 [Actinomycetota bacterium]
MMKLLRLALLIGSMVGIGILGVGLAQSLGEDPSEGVPQKTYEEPIQPRDGECLGLSNFSMGVGADGRVKSEHASPEAAVLSMASHFVEPDSLESRSKSSNVAEVLAYEDDSAYAAFDVFKTGTESDPRWIVFRAVVSIPCGSGSPFGGEAADSPPPGDKLPAEPQTGVGGEMPEDISRS